LNPAGAARWGFMRWVGQDVDSIHVALAEPDSQVSGLLQLQAMSELVRAKYRHIRYAVDAYTAALVVLAAAGLVSAVTR